MLSIVLPFHIINHFPIQLKFFLLDRKFNKVVTKDEVGDDHKVVMKDEVGDEHKVVTKDEVSDHKVATKDEVGDYDKVIAALLEYRILVL